MTAFPGDLKIANLISGSVTTVVRGEAVGSGGAWSDDDSIYYPAGEGGKALMRVRPAVASDRHRARGPNRDECSSLARLRSPAEERSLPRSGATGRARHRRDRRRHWQHARPPPRRPRL